MHATTTRKADELRRMTFCIERAKKVIYEHSWHYQRDPAYAELEWRML